MGMSVGAGGPAGKRVNSEINTTPLVDVMLVLLIIFLITIPVAVTSIKVELPKQANQPRTSKPENIVVSVNRDGDIFWNDLQLPNAEALFERLKVESVKEPQPELHVRGDGGGRYESVGRVVFAAQRAGIAKVAFVTEPPARN
ncbi:MAG TPA: biopolymer transporter ExbD [Piscinibacter sp.]|nr:MAG: biopolymer transporter ExbD [Burkholderiaceae bacterium]HNK17020.1 biopolymer transporter ExbD [Piscinibacter sp.]